MPPYHMGVTGLLHPCGRLPGHHCVSGSICVIRSLHIVTQGTRDHINRHTHYLLWLNLYCVEITHSGSNIDIPQQLVLKEYSE